MQVVWIGKVVFFQEKENAGNVKKWTEMKTNEKHDNNEQKVNRNETNRLFFFCVVYLVGFATVG